MDSHFQHAYIGSEMTAERGGYKNQQVDMIRHYAILRRTRKALSKEPIRRIFFSMTAPSRLRTMTESGKWPHRWPKTEFPGFTEGYVINAPSFIIM